MRSRLDGRVAAAPVVGCGVLLAARTLLPERLLLYAACPPLVSETAGSVDELTHENVSH